MERGAVLTSSAVMVHVGWGHLPALPLRLRSLCNTAPFTYVSFVYYLEGFGGDGREVEVEVAQKGNLVLALIPATPSVFLYLIS